MRKKIMVQLPTLVMWAVYSIYGYHAFYQTEEIARKHWKGSKKYGIEYDIHKVMIAVIPKVIKNAKPVL